MPLLIDGAVYHFSKRNKDRSVSNQAWVAFTLLHTADAIQLHNPWPPVMRVIDHLTLHYLKNDRKTIIMKNKISVNPVTTTEDRGRLRGVAFKHVSSRDLSKEKVRTAAAAAAAWL
jgi:hypothetical protein